MANPSLQIGNSNWAIKEDNLLGYSTAGTRFVPQPITMTRASAGTRVNSSGLVETVELLGSEEVTCGNFECASPLTYWNTGTGITIGSGVALFTSVPSGLQLNQVSLGGVVGKTYKISYEIKTRTEGAFSASIGGTLSSNQNSEVGVYTEYLTATGAGTFYIRSRGTTSGSIDNISVKEYTANNLARVDYDGTASSLLVEPERRNLVTYSEPTANEGAAANITYESFSWAIGFNNCVAFGDNSALRYRYGGSVTSGTEYTLSAYILMDDNSEPIVSNNNSIGDFSLNIGNTAASGTNTSVSMGNNIWRVSKTQTATQTTANNGIIKYTGQSSKGFKVVGLQMEVGSYATSYIPTDGTTVTRVQDQYSKTGISNLINSEEGVLFLEIAALSDDGTSRCISIYQNGSNFIKFLYSATSNRVDFVAFSGGNVSCNITKVISNTTENTKFGLKWKQNDFALWIDGVEVGTDTSGNTPLAMDKISFTDEGGSNGKLFGKVKQLQVFKTTDIDLAALTS